MAVLTAPQAKAYLNLTSSDYDTDVAAFVAAAEGAIVTKCGPLELANKTERVRGGRRALTLLDTPIVALTSVTALDGTAVTVGDLFVSPDAGRVTRTDGAAFSSAFYDVVYSCGREECPPDLKRAVEEMLRHMWDTKRGGSRRPSAGQSDALSNSLPGSAYTYPNRVTELITPYLQVKG